MIADSEIGTLRHLSVDWIGGFFDGEGSISINVRRYSIDIEVSFTQAYRPLLEKIKSSLENLGIHGGTIYSERKGGISRLIFDSDDSILRVLRCILPALDLKKRQAQATIDYLSDSLTGSEYLAIMNQEIDEGRKRRGKKHLEDQPWLRSHGIEMTRLDSMGKARSVYKQMRQAPNSRELERERAIERNQHRGELTQLAILFLLREEPMTSMQVARRISKTRQHARLLMKELFERSLLIRNRTKITEQFEYRLSLAGQRHLEVRNRHPEEDISAPKRFYKG